MIRIRTHVFAYPPPTRATKAVCPKVPGREDYTGREDVLIEKEYKRIGADFLAERLGRTVESIRTRARELGILGVRGDR